MPANSRTAKSLQNARAALLFYCLNLLLQFFSRKIFLDYLGSELLGLNTTAQNLLGFLNLAELGIGSAVAYNLYKPLFEGNRQTINEIVSIQGWLYQRVAYVVLAAACVLMFFFPWIFAKAQVPLGYAYGSFAVLLVSSLLGYFVNYRQIVLVADQRQYRITYSTQSIRIIKVILQILAVRFFSYGYVWWLVLELLMSVFSSYVLNRCVRKVYPWLQTAISKGAELQKRYPGIITKTKQIFFHQIGTYVLTQTSSLIIYAYASLTLVAVYGNYLLIINGITQLMGALLNGVWSGVGNLVAEGNKERIKSVFWELTVFRLWLASMICFGIYSLGHSFIMLWVGSEYVLPQSAYILLMGITFIQLSRTNEIFISAYGIFQDIGAPVVEAVLNLGLSVGLGYFYGLTGILSGVLISLLVMVVGWKPYFLYRYGFKESVWEYVWRYTKLLCMIVIAWSFSKWLVGAYMTMASLSYGKWMLSALIIAGSYILISLGLFCVADKAARDFIKRAFVIIS
ncbi:sugar transporter [Bacteroidales bacterium SW292]|nr:sugar transporter [Bacteroidales bacterium SW292]